jgi:hypothetical protein
MEGARYERAQGGADVRRGMTLGVKSHSRVTMARREAREMNVRVEVLDLSRIGAYAHAQGCASWPAKPAPAGVRAEKACVGTRVERQRRYTCRHTCTAPVLSGWRWRQVVGSSWGGGDGVGWADRLCPIVGVGVVRVEAHLGRDRDGVGRVGLTLMQESGQG